MFRLLRSCPSALDESITLLSGAAVPLALFILGASLNKFKLTSQLHVTSVLVVLKNIVLPLLVYVIAAYWLGVDSLWVTTAVIAAAMSAYAYAKKYQACEEQLAAGVFMSTILSLVSISVVFFLIQ